MSLTPINSFHRRGSLSFSSTSSLSDDEDAITPCPVEPLEKVQPLHRRQTEDSESQTSSRPRTLRRSDSWRREEGHFDPMAGEGDEVDTEVLWRRMLALQRIFGCYKSARMSAALAAGAQDGVVPSKTCLDLLNDSITQLPEEDRRQLDLFMRNGRMKKGASKKVASWKQRLLHGSSF